MENATLKSTEAEVLRRVHVYYKLICEGLTYTELIRHGRETWGVSTRQLDKYLLKAKNFLAEELARDRQQLLAEHIGMRRRIMQEARASGMVHITLAAAKDEAQLLGLYFSTADHIKALTDQGYEVIDPTSTIDPQD